MKQRAIYKNSSFAEILFIITAIIIGLSVGGIAILFKNSILQLEDIIFNWLPTNLHIPLPLIILLAPLLGGLVIGPLLHFFSSESKGSGIPEVMQAVAHNEGKIRPRVSIIKFITSIISISSGFSVGREGPIVQIGATIGSTLGQWFHLSEHKIKNFVACGAAAGIAATFNAPIAGVIFSLEVILGEFHIKHFTGVVLSAVSASVINQAISGESASLQIPIEYGVSNRLEFLFYPLLGIIAAIWAVLFIRSLYWTTEKFDSKTQIPKWMNPAIAGLLIGLLGILYISIFGSFSSQQLPPFYGVGYQSLNAALSNNLPIKIAIISLLLKLLATNISIGSGASGGVFAPSLYMGAMIGTIFDLGIRMIIPNVLAPPGAYALIGMAATFAATSHAPISTILILFELTRDYKIILPLMLTVVVATYFSQKQLKGDSIFTLKLKNKGIRIKKGKDLDILENVLVHEVMSFDITECSPKQEISELLQTLNLNHKHCAVLIDDEKFIGIITISSIDKALSDNSDVSNLTVYDITNPIKNIQLAFPNETIGHALAKMSFKDVGHLPVVLPNNHHELIGFITREDIIKAYKLALSRKRQENNFPTESF